MTSHVFNGVAIYGDARLARDQMVGSEMGIWMHPLEVIAWKYRKDPHARLDAALAWLNQRIEHKARMAVLRLSTEPPVSGVVEATRKENQTRPANRSQLIVVSG